MFSVYHVFVEDHTLLSGHFGEKSSLFKKPEEAECAELRWRRVGGHPFAACLRNVYCPGISSRQLKVTMVNIGQTVTAKDES